VSSSIPLPFAIAALVTAPATGFPAPLTPDSNGIFTIQGAGFAANVTSGPQPTQVALDTVGLTWTANTPLAAGTFNVTTLDPATGSAQIQFVLPSPLESGTYFVRIRVNGIESPPNFFVSA
jgi:hypothetical protein